MTPSSHFEFQEALRSHHKVQITGHGSQLHWLTVCEYPKIQTTKHQGIIDFRPDDLIVQVKSGTKLQDLIHEIAPTGLSIPQTTTPSNPLATVGGWLALGLPHPLESHTGHIRDLVTGMTLLLSNGDIAKVGCQVVKSVAGYDIHRTMVGSRGTLAIILDATLRLRSTSSIPKLSNLPSPTDFITKFPLSTVQTAMKEISDITATDEASGLIWSKSPPSHPHVVWIMGPDQFLHPKPPDSLTRLRRRLKELLDSENLFPEFL